MALLISYLLVATSQIVSYGRFAPDPLVLVLLGTAAGAWAVFGGNGAQQAPSKPALVLGLAALLLAAMVHNPLTYCSVPWWPAAYLGGLMLALALVASYLVGEGE